MFKFSYHVQNIIFIFSISGQIFVLDHFESIFFYLKWLKRKTKSSQNFIQFSSLRWEILKLHFYF